MYQLVLAPALFLLAAEPAPSAPAQIPTTYVDQAGPPQVAFPAPPPSGVYRDKSLSVSAGPGWLALHDAVGRDGQFATALGARLSVVVEGQWLAQFGLEHTTTSRGDTRFSQTALLVGAQRFFLDRFYVGGAFGAGWARASGPPSAITDGPGFAYSLGIGAEAMRGESVALTAELGLTVGHYGRETWEMGGLRLGVAIF